MTRLLGIPARLLRPAVVVAVYLAACRIMLAPICNFAALSRAIYGGDARLVAWALAWDNHVVLTGAPSLFDANIFFPARNALAYGEHFFGISLFSLPVYALSHNPTLAYNVVWILSYVLAAVAVHYLTWRLTSDHVASLVAGLAYAFCFFRMHHGHGHLHLLWSFWTPLSLVAMERWVARPCWRRLWLLTAIILLQALSSWYQAVMIVIADALLFLWLVFPRPLVERDQSLDAAPLPRLLVQAVVGASASLALIWPFARHYQVLASGGPAEAALFSADLTGLLIPPENTVAGRWLLQRGFKGPRWIWGELTIYVGWVTLLLAVAGAVVAIGTKHATWRRFRFYIALAVTALALANGPSAREVADNVWHWSAFGLLTRIPGADLFRAPARFVSLLTLALAVLAGAACARLHERFGRRGRVVSCLVIPFLLFDFYVVAFPGGPPPVFSIPLVYRRLATLPPGAVLSLPDYAATPEWFNEADYQLFSTAHWHPIVNGYSRGAPEGFIGRMQRLSGFPDSTSLDALQKTGIVYVVVHANRYGGGPAAVARASSDPACTLIVQAGDDYLFRIGE
jgi:hypothetical protein